MILIIMNFLIAATFGIVLSFPSFCEAGGDDYDLDQIKTVHGKVYREIYILGADLHGLSFRHREGIAKLGFSSLSENLRMLYEVVDDLEGDEGKTGVPDTTEEKEATHHLTNGDVMGNYNAVSLVFTVRHRVAFPPSVLSACEGYFSAGTMNWPNWWHRYHPVHQLTNPLYRGLAVRNFLHTSGLSPHTPGIAMGRIPYRPWSHFY